MSFEFLSFWNIDYGRNILLATNFITFTRSKQNSNPARVVKDCWSGDSVNYNPSKNQFLIHSFQPFSLWNFFSQNKKLWSKESSFLHCSALLLCYEFFVWPKNILSFSIISLSKKAFRTFFLFESFDAFESLELECLQKVFEVVGLGRKQEKQLIFLGWQ